MTASPKTSTMRIVVVGSGIAGLAAAIALRAPGREVTILESSSLKNEVGAAIHLAPNATKLVNRWGLDIQKEASATVCREFQEIGIDGKLHVAVPIDTVKAFGAPWLFQHRVDLHQALQRFAVKEDLPGSPAKIVTSAKVVAVDCEKGLLETADGKTYEADLIVGADGIHSVVRKAVLGEMKVAQPSGHSAYRCLIPKEKVAHLTEIDDLLSVDNSKLKIVVGGNRRVVFYPCRMATILNVVAICPDSSTQEQSTQSWNQIGKTEDMVEAFKGFPAWVTEALSKAKEPGLWQLRDQDPLPTWVKGRAIIIGDAAHAMLPHQGQGAGQSIEDAEALGTLFKDVTGGKSTEEVETILKGVFDARYERASVIQDYSRQQAMPVGGSEKPRLNAQQFVGYNMSYNGIVDWMEKQKVVGAKA